MSLPAHTLSLPSAFHFISLHCIPTPKLPKEIFSNEARRIFLKMFEIMTFSVLEPRSPGNKPLGKEIQANEYARQVQASSAFVRHIVCYERFRKAVRYKDGMGK